MSIHLPSCLTSFKIKVITQVLFLPLELVRLIVFIVQVIQKPSEDHLQVFLFNFHISLLLFFFSLMPYSRVRSFLTTFHSANLFSFIFLKQFIPSHQFSFSSILLFNFTQVNSSFQSKFFLFLINSIISLSFEALIRILPRISTSLNYNFLHFLNFNHLIL